MSLTNSLVIYVKSWTIIPKQSNSYLWLWMLCWQILNQIGLLIIGKKEIRFRKLLLSWKISKEKQLAWSKCKRKTKISPSNWHSNWSKPAILKSSKRSQTNMKKSLKTLSQPWMLLTIIEMLLMPPKRALVTFQFLLISSFDRMK